MSKGKIGKKLITSANLFPVVGIGASAGGLDAFKKLLKAIPEKSGIAYVLVQHLDPRHESMLPEILQKVTPVPVLEITADIKIQPDHIYIIPSNKILSANDGILQLSPRPPKIKKQQNLPIDIFFTSLAEVHQTHSIGVVLSGTASDGTRGLKAIKDHGGITFAQDESSAQYMSMPHNAAQAGVVDFILPPEEIPGKLAELVSHLYQTDAAIQDSPEQYDEIFKQILALLRIRKGTDFTYYKQTTIRRRILRRMALNKNNEPGTYLKFLREHKAEQDILYQDLLIPVTSFFRDRKSFENLCETIFPSILKNKAGNDSIRVWVAGCSTGEEAFSIAICLKQLINSHNYAKTGDNKINSEIRVQIFATDISEPAITKARKGTYSKSDIEGLTPQDEQDFFTKVNGNYQVVKSIRDMCVFAVHNFLKDPPFAKMDLVSCRNVLIYMEPYLQKKALTTFHYALIPKAFLLLGKSETCGSVPDLFANYGKNDKLFTRKDVPSRYMHVASQRSEQNIREVDNNVKNEGKLDDFQKTADDILLSRFTPAGVVINEAMEIVHFRGATGSYLEPSPGKASFNLIKMIKEGLAFELRNILHKAKTEKEPAVKENIPVNINGELQNITIEAIPLRNVIEPHYLVLFHSNSAPGKIKTGDRKSSRNKVDEKDQRIQQLEKELAQTREDMRTITEDQEAANEELQSANEELLSGSEELQSLNEELETSKEELQSTNEELIVINQEMISLNEQVTEARNYAEAIVTTIKEPLVIMDKNMRIKSANHSFYKTFMVSELETEGKVFFELGNGQWNKSSLKLMLENIISDKERFADYELKHNFPNIGERIMLLNAREMKEETGSERLILLAIEDVTEKREIQDKLVDSEIKFRTMADSIPQIIWTAEPDGNLDYFNRQWYTFTQFEQGTVDQNWTSLLYEDDAEKFVSGWRQAINTGTPFRTECRLKDNQTGNFKWFLVRSTPIKDELGKTIKWFGSFTEIEEQKLIENELTKGKVQAELSAKTAEEAVESKQQFLSNMSHEIRTPMNSIIGFTKVLLKSNLTEKQQEYVNAIKLSGDIMIMLINDILDLAKVDSGKMTFEKVPFKLADTLSTMIHLFEIKLQEKRIKLVKQYDPQIPEILSGDPARLHQVILNLMSNAIKFTKKGKITIAVRMLKDDSEKVEVEFSVTDTGIGIPEDKLSLIFDNFQQVHSDSTGSLEGTGLGLSIVKKLVEAQGGTINVTSKLNIGSVFTFTLNFQKTGEKPSKITGHKLLPENAVKIKVLVVEDIPLNQLLMKALLTDSGFKIEMASNGKMAIEKLRNSLRSPASKFNIVLMDLQMPEMNGYQTAAYIRNELKLDIPIIALSADTTREAIKKSDEAGMNDYISKPVDEKVLFSKIAKLLKIAGYSDTKDNTENIDLQNNSGRYTSLAYLTGRTKSNVSLIHEMVQLYLAQTPVLVTTIKKSIAAKDWSLLRSAAHKILPSFAIMGFDKEYQEMVKKIQEYDGDPKQLKATLAMVEKIEAACEQGYIELKEELSKIIS